MRVSPASLAEHCQTQISPVYLIFGTEILLVEECLDGLRQSLIGAGFTDRVRYTVETGFDWNQLFSSGQTLSLFSEKKIIELRLPTGKPGEPGGKAIVQYLETATNEDTTLVIVAGPIDKRGQNTKWFKAVESQGAVTECASVPVDRLPDWIAQRMMSKGLQFDAEVVRRLAHLVEGNLLAAAQEINLLALLYPDQHITADMMDGLTADHARFSTFTFVDACLAGSPSRCNRILQSLKQEQTEPILVLWALTREVRTLSQLSFASQNGTSPQSLFQRFGIWRSRAGLIQSALRRLSAAHYLQLQRRLANADLMLKGRQPLERENIWEEIEHIALTLCGVRTP